MIAIEASAGGATVSNVDPVNDKRVAEIVVLPCPWLDAKPAELTVATPGLVVFHVATLVTSCVLPSLKTPIAVNCLPVPSGIAGFTGLRKTDCKMAAVTFSDVESL